MPDTDPYAPKYTPFPPKGKVEHCFVKINPNSFFYGLVAPMGAWATGMLTAWCRDEDDLLNLTTLGGDKAIVKVRRQDVLRPYWP
jgi:hypothetical protein